MTILVTSLEPSTGKTAVTLALAEVLRERGDTVGYMKPKGTRLESAVGKTLDEDPKLARELLGLDAELHELEPIVYSPTFVTEVVRGREDETALREQLETRFESLADGVDRMLLEGGDRISTGRSIGLSDADIAELFDATVIIVADYEEPKDVDELLAAADRLGDRLGGILFNDVSAAAFDSLSTDIVPFLESRGVRVYGTVPRDEALAGSPVSEIAAEIGADVLTGDVPTDGLVQRFVVGATSAGEVLSELRRVRDAALVTGGDRADVQTAVLEASGVGCLILTGGFEPSSAVVGRAESANVPVLAVRTDTKTTLDRLEALVRSGRTRDAETVDRMRTLLGDYTDIDAMTEP